MGSTLQQYVFSRDVNDQFKGSGAPPNMLARWLSGLLHPFIHTGHIEFGMPGMLSEGIFPHYFTCSKYIILNVYVRVGLAQTCVTDVETAPLFPAEFFRDPELVLDHQSQGSFISKLASLTFISPPSVPKETSLSTLDIVARILADPRLEAQKVRDINSTRAFDESVENVGKIIREHTRLWIVPTSSSNSMEVNSKIVKEKVEELQWLATILYGLGGYREGRLFRTDFYL